MNIDVILDELISKGILPADVKWQVLICKVEP